MAEGSSKGMVPWPGDTVEFRISLDKPKNKRFAQQVRLVELSEEGREMGVVSRVKGTLVLGYLLYWYISTSTDARGVGVAEGGFVLTKVL
jgi:hypothetical protein